jgi:sorting nexin-29
LILNIWDNKQLPDQWNERIICPIFKKGERLNCENYRPITLLNIAYKIYAILLNNILVKTVGKQLSDAQMGFRPNRSTIDNIFIIRHVFEKCHEFNIELHNIFIDYSRALDSVYRNKITECLLEYGVPTKLIRLISLTLIDTKAKIKVNNSLSNDFKAEFGVRQGDPLSATL